MICDGIVAITSIEDNNETGKAELIVCEKALRIKYAGRVKVFASVCAYDSKLTKFSQENSEFEPLKKDLPMLQRLSEEWKAGRSPGIGLYLQGHGNQFGTRPPADQLAERVSQLYKEWQLAFRKINISICFSAGKEKTDVSESSLTKFCSTLRAALGDQDAPLHGLMVAGYRSAVTFSDGTSPRNTFEEKKAFTHPKEKLDPKIVEMAHHVAGQDLTDAKVRKDLPKQLMTARNKLDKAQNDQLQSLQTYVLWKLVRKYNAETKNWTPTSISEYSDNLDTRYMAIIGEHLRHGFSPAFGPETGLTELPKIPILL
jgi:hypothetical protein